MVDTIRWDEISGAASHYARDMDPPLRSEGRPRHFRSTAAFKEKLDGCFEEIWAHSGLGTADVVVSAGALVNKPGMHGQGEALDLDAIIWRATDDRPEVSFYAIDFPKEPVLYCSIGALLNRHFVHTLHYLYNAPHEDHFHIDTSIRVGFSTKSRSRVGFMQATLRFIHGIPLVLDSSWGPKSASATDLALARLGLPGSVTTPSVWSSYLLETARIGFSESVIAPPVDDPDRKSLADPPPDLVPEEDHEKPPGQQKRSPRFYVDRPRIRGEIVLRIQRALDAAGHSPGPIDGIFGTRTRWAVQAFQREHDLEIDGVVGPVTSRSLSIDLA